VSLLKTILVVLVFIACALALIVVTSQCGAVDTGCSWTL